MSKIEKKQIWAAVVAGLLAVIALATIDVALMLHDGVEVEYVNEGE